MAKNKGEGEDKNPFFRGRESEFNGGELTVMSPVGSIFGDYIHQGQNAMDTAIEEQAPGGSKRSVSGKGAK